MLEKLPKFIFFGTAAITGWLLPASAPLPKSIQGLSLAFSFGSALVLAVESRRCEIQSRFTNAQTRFEFERLATEMAYQQQAELDELHDRYYPEPEYQPQPQLPGSHIGQPVLGGSASIEENNRHFNLDWLLSSNSHHALLCGDSGAGKTLLARWLLGQLGIQDVTVLDPDDDGSTWAGYEVVGTNDNYEAIDSEGYLGAIQEFNARKPNDPNLIPKAYVLEELPDHLEECDRAEDVLGRLLRRGRKRKVFILAITQDCNEKAIKLSAPLRACFTTFYLQGYAYHALKYLCHPADRPHLLPLLKECQRPALVQFKGAWYVWDVPTIQPPQFPTPTSTPRTTQEEGTIATLNRILNDSPAATELHWAIVDFSMDKGEISVRDAMRRFSAHLKTADQTRTIFQELVGLELGETRTDGDRLLFKAYS